MEAMAKHRSHSIEFKRQVARCGLGRLRAQPQPASRQDMDKSVPLAKTWTATPLNRATALAD